MLLIQIRVALICPTSDVKTCSLRRRIHFEIYLVVLVQVLSRSEIVVMRTPSGATAQHNIEARHREVYPVVLLNLFILRKDRSLETTFKKKVFEDRVQQNNVLQERTKCCSEEGITSGTFENMRRRVDPVRSPSLRRNGLDYCDLNTNILIGLLVRIYIQKSFLIHPRMGPQTKNLV